jgi:thiamine pyrophosphokinase
MVLNGSPPSEELLRWRTEEADHVLAVDGGWHALRHANLLPDAVIGDFDSFDEAERVRKEFPSIALHHFENQDRTDFQKACDWVADFTQTKCLTVLGGLGNRSDHFLSNLFAAMQVNVSWVLSFDDEREWIRRITPSTPLVLNGRKGATISLLPLVDCFGVQSSGLSWEITNANLSPATSFSQSNQCETDEVRIECTKGTLFAVVPKGL